MSLSIVIPSYCSEKSLPSCLESIGKQIDTVADAEVIVVDCSPTDLVKEICSRFPFVKFIKSEKRFNPGEGRNIGTRESKGTTLVFIDGDIVLGDNALANIEKNVAKGNLAFGAALELNEFNDVTFSSYVEHYYFNHESHSSRKETTRNNLSSAFLVINKDLFNQAGGFKDIPRMQDTELTERLAKQGVKLMLTPDVVGYQTQDSKLSKVLNKIKITGNNLYFIRYKANGDLLTKMLLLLALPFLMIAKISRINYRNLKYAFSLPMMFIYSPFMYICGVYWMVGFYRGILRNEGIDQKR